MRAHQILGVLLSLCGATMVIGTLTAGWGTAQLALRIALAAIGVLQVRAKIDNRSRDPTLPRGQRLLRWWGLR